MVTTLKRIWLYSIIALMFCACEVFQLSIDEREFFIAKEWKIESFIGNGNVQTVEEVKASNPAHSPANYRLILSEDYTFTRTDIKGVIDNGTWSLASGLTQLKLDVSGGYIESWLIIDLQVRRLEIKYTGSSEVKDRQSGILDMIYVLEPVKGQ